MGMLYVCLHSREEICTVKKSRCCGNGIILDRKLISLKLTLRLQF